MGTRSRGRRLAGAAAAALALGSLGGGVVPAVATAPGYAPYQVYPLGAEAASAVVADVNGDGRNDVIVSTSGGSFELVVYVQATDGTLRPPARYPTLGEPGDPMGIAAGDLDGNGLADVAVASRSGVELFYAGSGGLARGGFLNFGPAYQVEIVNLDGYLTPEVVVAGHDGIAAFWRALDGSGGYSQVAATNELQAEIEMADMTGDGFPDIVGFIGHTVNVFPQIRGDGFGMPRRYAAIADPYWPSANGLAVGDLNGDGLADVALSTSGSSGVLVNVFVQTEPGTAMLSGPSLYESVGIPDPLEIGDLDGDGHNELVAASLGLPHVGVWSLGPSFRETTYEVPETADYRPKSLAFGDVNGDGIGDVVLADPSNGLVVLRSGGSPPADTVPPQTTITGGQSGTVASTTATFTFAADEPATFACSFDNGPFAPCTSPATYAALTQGIHELRVRATDTAGNVDTTPAVRKFTVDTRPPETTITGGPSGIVTSTSASFTFAADERATFTCAMDGGPATPCGSPAAYAALADGSHQFQVRATDPVGNADQTPATRTFTVQRPSDLAVQLTATPEPVKSKSQLTYRMTVTNTGPGGNTGVSATLRLPAKTTVVSVPASCTSAGTPAVVTCTVASMAAGATTTVDVVVRVDAKRGAILTAAAQVAGARVDPDPADNSAGVSSTVR